MSKMVFAAFVLGAGGCAILCWVIARENDRVVARQAAMRRHPSWREPAGFSANRDAILRRHPDLIAVDGALDETAEKLARFYA